MKIVLMNFTCEDHAFWSFKMFPLTFIYYNI